MKKALKFYVIDTFSLFAASQIAEGMIYEKGVETLILAGLGLMGASLVAKPVINILILPINLVTFGMFRWISTAIVLYIVTLIIPGFSIQYFKFQGLISKWIDIPAFEVHGIFAYIAYALLISVIITLLSWIFK